MLLVAGRRAALLAFAFAEALTPLLVNLTKLLVGRERPPAAMIEAHGSSYPSGHAAYAGVTAVLLVLLFTTRGRLRRAGWAVAVVSTVGMAWSRTYLQVHWLLGRSCRSHARRRRRPAQPRGPPDPLDAAPEEDDRLPVIAARARG